MNELLMNILEIYKRTIYMKEKHEHTFQVKHFIKEESEYCPFFVCKKRKEKK